MCTQRDWLVFTERNSFNNLFWTCFVVSWHFGGHLVSIDAVWCNLVVVWTDEQFIELPLFEYLWNVSFDSYLLHTPVLELPNFVRQGCGCICFAWRQRFISVFCKRKTTWLLTIWSSSLQHCISGKSVCIKIPCKLRIKRSRGLIMRFGWFCKSSQLKILSAN